MQDLDPTYAAGLAKTVALLRARAMMVILDVHNYARYRRDLIGSPAVPVAAFQDLWKRLAIIHKDEPHVWGYGLMNEPGNGKAWKDAAQAAIDGIRSVDRWTQILVANDYPGWGATAANRKPGLDLATWAEGGMPIPIPSLLRDPSDNLRFELHTYFDHDNSGTYRVPYEKEIVRTDGPGHRVMPEIGIQRMKPFVEWLRRHKVRGFIGEYSAPANAGVDPRWLDILDRTMAYMQENNLPSTYWAGGQRWSQGNPMIIEPSGWLASLPDGERLRERPQLTLLRKYATAPTDHGMQEGRRAPWMKP
jgi:endoglucanase